MILAHGGAAGGAIELAVLLVPLAILGLFTWWSRRHGVDDKADSETADPGTD